MSEPRVSYRSAPIVILLAFVAFISLGLPDCVLGVAWPSVRETFSRPFSQIGWLLTAGTVGYLCASFFGGQAVRWMGVGMLLFLSSLCVAIALAGYWLAPVWGLIVAAAVIGGLGAGAIDSGINSFAASHFSPRIINWLHASWGIGATTGPLLMTFILTQHFTWRSGYAVLSAMLFALSLLFLSTLRLWKDNPTITENETLEPHAGLIETIRRPLVWMQAAIFFFYAGLETTAGQLLFPLFTESRGVKVGRAGVTVSAYWAALTVGRIAFGQISTKLGARAVLRIGTLAAPLAALLITIRSVPYVDSLGAVLLGCSLAPIYPMMISVTPRRLGKRFAAHAIGFQVSAASIGIASCPGFSALLARKLGLEAIGPCLIILALIVLALHELVLLAAPQDELPGVVRVAAT